MSCDDVRSTLPLLPGSHPDEAQRVQAHCATCDACAEVFAGFEADARLLGAARAAPRPAPAALDGFTASVMARIEAEKKRAPAPIVRFPTWQAAAAAAALLLGVGVGLRGEGAPAPAPVQPVAVASPIPAGDVTDKLIVPTDVAPLPAPVREHVPTPRRRPRGDVLPAGNGGRTPGLSPGLPPGLRPEGIFEDLERILPELQRRMQPPPARGDAREVKF